MHIRLHASGTQILDISYDQDTRLFEELFHMIKGCLLWGNRKKSSISEYQHRMHSLREYWASSRSNRGSYTCRGDKRARMLSLDELYAVKGKCNAQEGADGKNTSMYIYILVSFFVSLEIALLLRMTGKIIGGGGEI